MSRPDVNLTDLLDRIGLSEEQIERGGNVEMIQQIERRIFELSIPSTSYNNPDLSRMSGNLTDVMNHVGFSEKHRKDRVKFGVMWQMLDSIRVTITLNGKVCPLRFGSIIEGTTADGMGYDEDTLAFSTSVRAYCKKENTKENLGVVLIHDKLTPAGYTKLQPAFRGCVINDASDINLRRDSEWWMDFEADNKRRLMVAHFIALFEMGLADLKHGPADTFKDRPNTFDQDIVKSFICDDITDEMEEWYMRDRIHDWPNKETRDLFMTLGCFVVSVGHPSSPEQHLEWRMSFSLQERHLMWHLNPTQYHCFMLLKLIKTFLIKPKFGGVLTSYHCKTLLFYTIERHEQGIWIPKNLILCLRMCLNLLHEWISDRYIPNYFIPKENMFVKMDAALKDNYGEVMLFVASLCDNWQFLFYITFNDLGTCLLEKINGESIHACIIERTPLYKLYTLSSLDIKVWWSSDCDVYIQQIHNLLDYLDVVLAVLRSSRNCTRYKTFEENIQELYKQWFTGSTQILDTPQRFHKLTESFLFYVEHTERKPRVWAVMAYKAILQMVLGSVLEARYFQTGNIQYLHESTACLELGKSLNPMASMLVKASVLLKQSLFDTNDIVLNAAEIICKDSPYPCICYKSPKWNSVVGVRKMEDQTFDKKLLSNTENNNTVIASGCLYFKICEFDIVPVPLRFEAYRALGSPEHHLHPFEKIWRDLVVVDPVMYLYYLQFLNNQHRNPGEAAFSLQKLENTLFDRLGRSDRPEHIDTWLNVLGDIFVKKGWTRLALKCFKQSHKLRPLHNAVKWHVMFLLFSPSGGDI